MNQTLELIATDDVELGTVTRRWFKFGGEVYGITEDRIVLDADGMPIDTFQARLFLKALNDEGDRQHRAAIAAGIASGAYEIG